MLQTMHVRSSGIFMPTDKQITIIGAGGIGSPLALLLAKIGCQNLTIYDDDWVDEINVGSQLYRFEDIGKQKVEALADTLKSFANVTPKIHNQRTDGKGIMTDILILAVDSMEARKTIAENAVYNHIVDGRMGAQVYSIYTVPAILKDDYLSSLITDREALNEPCTAKAICYNTFSVASNMANTVKKLILNEPTADQQHACLVNQIYYTE